MADSKPTAKVEGVTGWISTRGEAEGRYPTSNTQNQGQGPAISHRTQ